MSKNIQLSLLSVALISSLHAQTNYKLDTIEVTGATKTSQSIKDVTSNISVLTDQDIDERGFNTVVDAINSMAGVGFTQNGGMGSTTNINLRGMSNNRVVVLIDGVRLNDPSSTSGASLQHLMIQDISRIEIIKGAQSGIWGADATAGVINIITKVAKKGTSASLNIEGGSYGTKKVGAIISHKAEKFDLKLAINRIQSDGFTSQAPKGDDISKYEDDAYENLTIKLKANYFITDSAIIGFSITDIDALKEYDSYGNPNDTTMKSDINTRLYSLSYKQKYKNHNVTLKADKSEFKRDEIGTIAQWGSEYVKVFNGDSINIEANDKIAYREKDFIIVGLGSSSDDVEYTMTDSSKNSKKNSDNYIYATNENIVGDLIVSESARYDNYDNFDSKATGKVGIRYNLQENMFVTTNVGTAYNVPNIVQELNPWGASTEGLNPENSISYDISFGYKNFKATYFMNEVKDLIEWYDPDGWGGNPAIYKNLDGKSKFKGFELEYAQNIMDDIYLSLNYTKLTAEDKDGDALARRAEQQFDIATTYYISDNLDIGLDAQYIGERFDKADKQGEQTGKYILANLITNYELNKNLSFYAKADNITDKEYQSVDGYATARRSFYLGFNAKY